MPPGESVTDRIVREAIGDRAEFLIPDWWQPNFWEPTVQLALRDLCKPGDVVFDVGASAGALSLLMSRLVGLKGEVHAFEASPRVIDKTQFNFNRAGCANVRLTHAAVYRTSGERVSIKESGHSLADSIYQGKDTGQFVETIALDDFVRHWGARPSLIKMDIEGAEFDALNGATNILSDVRPHLILEQDCADPRCLAMLGAIGYRAVDLATYIEVSSGVGFLPGVWLANVLCIHESRLAETPYRFPLDRELVLEMRENRLSDFDLAKGRFTVEALISGDHDDNEMMAGIKIGGEHAVRYHTNTRFLSNSYRFFPLHLRAGARASLFFDFLSNTEDPSFRVEGVRVWRVPCLSDVVHAMA